MKSDTKILFNGEFKPRMIYWVSYTDGKITGKTSFVLGYEDFFLRFVTKRHKKIGDLKITPLKELGEAVWK